MAGANETPRNKLIALMYLVFITMLALNVSKEVLDGFGQMFKKIQSANERVNTGNEIYYNKISTNSEEKEGKWIGHDRTAKEIRKESTAFYNRIQEIKNTITADRLVDDPNLEKYSEMDKGEKLDLIFFDANGVSLEGKEFIDLMNNYKMRVIQVFASQYPQYTELVEERFYSGDFNNNIKNKDGVDVPWLVANYEGFPLISSLAKLTMMQNDIRLTESDVLNALLGKELEAGSRVNKDNYISFLKTEKGAYYQGETFDGSVILGRKGGAQNPNEVSLTLDGNKLTDNQYELIPGGIKLNVKAGRPGDHVIEGDLIFLNNGIESRIEVNQSFPVIAKPNSPLIRADKMNVVYRGVENPMTISIPGIQPNKVKASAPGLRRVKGSKYVIDPGKGRTVKFVVSGTLPDGKKISTSEVFRIKDVPAPAGLVAGESGNFKISKNDLTNATIGAGLVDFDFPINLKVKNFKFKVPGSATINVQGNKLSSKAKSALRRAKKGMQVTVYGIEVVNPKNPKFKFKETSTVICTII